VLAEVIDWFRTRASLVRRNAKLEQQLDAQFAHNTVMREEIERLREDTDFAHGYLGRIEGIVNGTGSRGHIKWDLAERIQALVDKSVHEPR